MKKLLLLFVATLLLAACSNSVSNDIIKNADKVIGTKPAVEGNVYTYKNVTEKNLYKDYKDIKESIDKTLNALPIETNERGVTAHGELYTSYKWETPKAYVLLWVGLDEEFIQITARDK